jgi:hypothetical protein
MGVPDDATLHSLQAWAESVGFTTGTAALEDMAWATAWEGAEDYLSTNILTGAIADERHIFPRGFLDYDTNFRYLMLDKTYLQSITSVVVAHDTGSCDCDTDDIVGCVLTYDLKRSIVEVREAGGAIAAGCGCLGCGKPAWVDVAYVAGIWNTPADIPISVKMALAVLAAEAKDIAGSGGASVGAGFVNSWRSMDYSESSGLQAKTPLGTSAAANYAYQKLRKYKVRRMAGLRGRPSVIG